MTSTAPATPPVLRSTFAGEADMAELVSLFVSETPARVQMLQRLWEEQAMEDLCRVAHQLKGAGGGYGFPSITDAARRLEDSIRSLGHGGPGGTDQLRSSFDHLMNLLRRVQA